jgi:hypothetical protein
VGHFECVEIGSYVRGKVDFTGGTGDHLKHENKRLVWQQSAEPARV